MKSFIRCSMAYLILRTIVFIIYEAVYLDAHGGPSGVEENGYRLFEIFFTLIIGFFIGPLVFRMSGQYQRCEKENIISALRYFAIRYLGIILVMSVGWCFYSAFNIDIDIGSFFYPLEKDEGMQQRYVYSVLIGIEPVICYIITYASYTFTKSFSMAQKIKAVQATV